MFSTLRRLCVVASLVGCASPIASGDSGDADGAADAVPIDVPLGPAIVRMDFAASLTPGDRTLLAAPFPSEHRRLPDGRIDLRAFANPRGSTLIDQSLSLLRADADGFATTAGIYVSLTAPIDRASLPADVHASVRDDASVFVVGVQAGSPDRMRRQPVTAYFDPDGGPHGAPNQLALLPWQGRPLRPGTLYAAVVTRRVRDTRGEAVVASESMRALASGSPVPGLTGAALADYQSALTVLRELSVPADDIAGLAVFRTGTPLADFERVRAAVAARSAPATSGGWTRTDLFDAYCVYQSTVRMPVYQGGTPPYDTDGGAWIFDAMRQPMLQREEDARVFVTIPRRPMPADGYPMVYFVRTGGGGDRPLIDRGVHATHGGPSLAPGTGYALQFAQAGYAGASIDGPLGGLRNPWRRDEQFLMFNVGNVSALRDNVRQSGIETILATRILEGVRIDVTDCPGATVSGGGMARFDAGRMGIMGHSMGASVAPLASAFEPRYHAMILSGAGSSWIENVMWKQSPVAVRPAIELMLRYQGNRRLEEHDIALSLLQWAGEPADVQIFGRSIVAERTSGAPPHVLMFQGIVDTYIMPPIAAATSLSIALDLAGPSLDAMEPRIAMFPTLGSQLPLNGRATRAFPVQSNLDLGMGNTSTGAVVQIRQDTIEDGHEVAFQTEQGRRTVRCFLESLSRGAPRIEGPAALDAPCM